MKKLLLCLTAGVLLCASMANVAHAQQASEKKIACYGVAFYNLENLFDTIHAPGKNDYEFLPEGSYRWNALKYNAKLKNMSTVLSMLCKDKVKSGAAIIGVSEVENRTVLEDLLKQPALKDRGYKILHQESPDRRGVDCAFFYNPRFFQLEDSLYIFYIYPNDSTPSDPVGFNMVDNRIVPTPLYGDTTHITRGFFVGIGRLAGERVAVIVNHWPSRGASSPYRERAGMQVKRLCDALYQQYNGDVKMIIMGDLNDDPDNKSMTEGIRCKFYAKDLESDNDFFNPWYYTLRKQGKGTLLYNNKWNLFDQILVSGNMVNRNHNLKQTPKVSDLDLSGGLTFYQNVIFMRDFLFQQEGKYKGNPLRTHAGGSWLNGYSDHLPTQIYLLKEM